MDKIAILGSGSWGTALGKILAEKVLQNGGKELMSEIKNHL